MTFVDTFMAMNKPKPKSTVNVDLSKGNNIVKMSNSIVAGDSKSFQLFSDKLGLTVQQKDAVLSTASRFGYKI